MSKHVNKSLNCSELLLCNKFTGFYHFCLCLTSTIL